jgi:hypothetical protein
MKQSIDPFKCPHCEKRIATKLINRYTASRAGRVMSPARVEANRINGAKGGRPKGSKDKRRRIRRAKKQISRRA